MSQFSESALSDILPGLDVDHFISENGIKDHMDMVLNCDHKPPVPEEEDYLSYAQTPTQELQDHDYKLPSDQLLHAYTYNLQPEVNNYLPPLSYPPEESPALEEDEYAGKNDFEVLVIPNGQKTPWEYSAKLNKIFITMGLKVPVAFSLRNRPNVPLFIRATPVYSQPHHFRDLVHRCIGHEATIDSSNRGVPDHIRQHIIRCQNEKALYCGDKHKNKRLSVIVPLSNPQAGADTVKEYYSFVCKNSCTPGGMNRRPIQIIFTLENINGDVWGRRVVSVRICSCPKRDKEKEEKECNASKEEAPAGKKRKRDNDESKTSTSDTKVYTVNYNIVGKDNYKKVLEMGRGLMASQILNENKGANSSYRKCFKEISELLNKEPE